MDTQLANQAGKFDAGGLPNRLPPRVLPVGGQPKVSAASSKRKQAAAKASPWSRFTGHAPSSAKPLDKRDLMMVVTQLSIMTRSGVDLAESIRSISKRATKQIVRDALGQVHAALEEGCQLSQALAAQGERFGGVVVASVAAGEASGRLSDVLTRLRLLIRDELRTRSAIRSLISYPAVLVLVTTGVLAAMIFFVMPQFAGIYENARTPTPALTQLLLDSAQLLRSYWWAALLTVVAGAVGLWRMACSHSGRRRLDRLCFRVPVIRDVCRSLGLGRVFRLQGVLLESGVPLLEVLQLTRRASRNTVVQDLNARMQQAVISGRSMSSQLVDAECVPDGAVEMIATAEANGELSGVLQSVGEFFESEGEQQLRDVVKIAEPAIIVGLGVVVGAIVLAVMLPMLDLSSAASM